MCRLVEMGKFFSDERKETNFPYIMLHELCEKFLSIRTEAQTYTYPFDGSAELS